MNPTIIKAANNLNEMLAADVVGMNSMFRTLHMMSPKVINTPLECMPVNEHNVGVSSLGLLNGALSDGDHRIEAQYTSNGNIQAFVVVAVTEEMYITNSVNIQQEETDKEKPCT